MMSTRLPISRLLTLVAAFVLALGAVTSVDARNRGGAQKAYPNAAREEPRTQISRGNATKVNKASDYIGRGELEKAQALFEEIRSAPRATPYEKAIASVGLANVYWEMDDPARAIELNKEALASNALNNEAHFNAMLAVAQMALMDEQYELALTSIDQWLAESGNRTGDALAVRGNALYRLERYPEAVASIKEAISLEAEPNESWYPLLLGSLVEAEMYEEAAQIASERLAKDPNNKNLSRQLAGIYLDLDRHADAIAVMEQAKQRGLLTEESDLRQLYQMYNFVGQPAKASVVIIEGLAAGILKEDEQTLKGLADSYALAAEAAVDESAEQKNLWAKAADAYGRAAALSSKGEHDFQRGHLLYELERFAESKESMRTALRKGGLSREGEAWILLGNAELELGDRRAAIAAYEKARAFPSTKKMAETWLKSARGGG